MSSASTRSVVRLAAVIAVVALAGAVFVLVSGILRNVGSVLIAIGGVSLVIVGGWYSLSKRGATRLLALGAVVAGVALLVVGLIAGDYSLVAIVATVALAALSTAAAGYALHEGEDEAATAPHRTSASPASRAVLIMNPWSGGGKVEKFDLPSECRARGIEPIVLKKGDDLLQLAEDAIAAGADVIGMAGGDGSQALVSSVASRHGIPHVVIPAGTRNHFALDLGLDRDDVVGALDAFTDGVETTIDLAEVNGRVFVNNASLGVYAKIVQSPEYRDAKVQTTLATLPDLVGPDAAPLDLRFDGPDGEEVPTAQLIQVSNNRYELRHAKGRGTRARLDAGVLGVVAAQIESAAEFQRLVALQASGQLEKFPGWREWTAASFEVRSGGPIEIGVDGEALEMEPPLVFTSRPNALTVRLPKSAGLSPAAKAVYVTSPSTLVQLGRLIVGRRP
ncbi:MAG: diacylglycerol/lipid kinase family protein [Actinomycetota bacterium]